MYAHEELMRSGKEGEDSASSLPLIPQSHFGTSTCSLYVNLERKKEYF